MTMITIIVAVIISNVIGFVSGALVYRNNAKRFEAGYAESQAVIADLKARIDALKG